MKKENKFGLGRTGFIDVCLNLAIGFVLLFLIVLFLLRPEGVTTESNAVVAEKLMVRISWNDSQDNDVDLFVKSESPESIVSFRNRTSSVMYLDHDDLGNTNDTIITNDKKVVNPINQEIVYIKYPGNNRYIVNLLMFANRTNTPSKVTVELITTQPHYKVKYQKEITISKKGEQQTAFIFYTDDNGDVDRIVTGIQENITYVENVSED